MNCIIYTVKNDPVHIANFSRSIELVKRNLLPFVETDILLFHDAGIEWQVSSIVDSFEIKNKVFLITFNTVPPPHASKVTVSVNYKNMCRFWAGEVFKNEKVKEYDYYMRLDCDSFITEPVGYDPFQKMKEEDKDYGFLSGGKFKDTPPYYEGLNIALRVFESQFPLKMKNRVKDLEEGTLYYTNFEICRVKAFSESLYMNLYDHIDRVGGIYVHRWGDHIIRYAGIHMILGFDRVKEFTDIKYTHQRFVNGKII